MTVDAVDHLAVPRGPGLPADAIALERLLGQLELAALLRCAAGICDALMVLHDAGLVHHDVKPSSIWVSPSAGMAWLGGVRPGSVDPAAVKSGHVFSSLAYLAPERTGRLSSLVDCRADLYSLGVTLYQLATGKLPFAVNDPHEWVHAHVAARPVPPAEHARLPDMLQRILLKLLEKEPDARYQTAAGLAHDLRECLSRFEATGAIAPFPLGRRDFPGHLSRGSAFHGRSRELDELSLVLERVQRTGAPELVLVTGYSGIGKSSLVRELLLRRLPAGALAVAGKFDDIDGDAPHSTLMHAFREVCRWILTKPAAELAEWKTVLLRALGGNAGVVVKLVPELAWIVGALPAPVPLAAEEAQNRLYGSCRQLLRAITQRQRPLIVFLDDLQWLDAASLCLIEHLLLDPELAGVLVVGALRVESVNAEHPLCSALDRLTRAGRPVHTLALGPLPASEVGELVADVLLGAPEQTAELAALVEQKTAGNPFFVRQFLTALEEEHLLRFDAQGARWAWDASRIAARGPTDNLSLLLLDRLARLPAPTQRALETLACLGVPSSAELLADVSSLPIEVLRERLLPAVQADVIAESGDHIGFRHDRLLTAAYSRIPEAERPARHFELGRALREREQRLGGDTLFEIVRHLNRGVDLVRGTDARVELAALNMEVARRSRATAASVNALPFLEQASSLLPEDHWDSLPNLSFELALARAESELLSGSRATAEMLLAELAGRELDLEQHATVVCVQLPLYLTSNRVVEAVDSGLSYLRRVGTVWPSFDDEALRIEYEKLLGALGDRPIAALAGVRAVPAPSVRVVMEVCASLVSPAYFLNQRLFALLTMHMATLSIENGHCDGSAFAYSMLCMVLGPFFGAHDLGLKFGHLGSELAGLGANRFAGRAWLVMGALVAPRAIDAHAGHAWLVRACETSDQFGDLLYGVYTRAFVVVSLLGAGAPLEEAERQADMAIAHARRYEFGLIADRIGILRALIRGLRTPGRNTGSLSDEELDEASYERALGDGADRYYYWVRRAQARYYAGDFVEARAAARRARQLIWTSPFFPEELDLWLFGALAEAACDAGSDPAEALNAVTAYESELLVWAERCPATFASKAALVSGERARLCGRAVEAEQHFEHAAELARQHRLIHEEALAHELSARLYAVRGIGSVARAKLAAARSCYSQWGALGKVTQLDALVSADDESMRSRELAHSLERLDVHVLASALQAVSGSLETDELIEALMKAVLQHAAAERGGLVLQEREPRIRALATSETGTIRVVPADRSLGSELLPESVVRYVLRSSARVCERNGTAPTTLGGDPYFEKNAVQAWLCFPLVARGKAIGAVYLESTLTRQAFSAHGLSAVDLIASQAAVALENARLYADLQRAQQRMARAEDVSRTASFVWRPDTQESEWSEQVSTISGIEGPPSMKRLWERIHPEDRALFDSMFHDSARYDGRTVELRLSMPGGAIKHLAVIASRRTTNEYVGTLRDVTESRQTEAALQRTQAALTDMTRVASLGEMAAAIAHEVNQPLSAIGLNASTCLRWLDDAQLNLGEAREAALRIRRDASRAAAVVQRLRALFKKSEGVRLPVDLNDAVTEVVALARNRIRAADVALTLSLHDELPQPLGDRVQLQQVLMNLLINALEALKGAHESRALTIRTLPVEGVGVRCEVRDSGPGVSEAAAARIFEAFYSTKPDGMGMGLSICRNILGSHGGELGVCRNADAPGATFYFTLPLPSSP